MAVIKISQREFFKALKELSTFKFPHNIGNGYNNTLTFAYTENLIKLTLVNSRFQVQTVITNNFTVDEETLNQYGFSHTLPFDSLLSYEQLINSSNQSGILTLEFNDHLLHLAKDNIQIDYQYTNEPEILDNIMQFVQTGYGAQVLGNDFAQALSTIDFVTDKEGSSIGGAIINFGDKLSLSGYSGNKVGTTTLKTAYYQPRTSNKPYVINQKDISRLTRFTKAHKDDFIYTAIIPETNILEMLANHILVTFELSELNDTHIMPFIKNIPNVIKNSDPNVFNYQQLISQLPALNTKLLLIDNSFIEKAGSSSSNQVNLSVDLKIFKKMLDNTVYMNSSRMSFTKNGTNNVVAIYNKSTAYLLTETKRIK